MERGKSSLILLISLHYLKDIQKFLFEVIIMFIIQIKKDL